MFSSNPVVDVSKRRRAPGVRVNDKIFEIPAGRGLDTTWELRLRRRLRNSEQL